MSDQFVVEIVCSKHDRPRVIDSFVYAEHNETHVMQWFWQSSKRTGGGKLDHVSGVRDWYEKQAAHQTVREDDGGTARVRLYCRGHADVGMTWDDLVSRFLEPLRAHGRHTVPVREIERAQKSPTHRR